MDWKAFRYVLYNALGVLAFVTMFVLGVIFAKIVVVWIACIVGFILVIGTISFIIRIEYRDAKEENARKRNGEA